ncbi:MAG: DUF447 family protein [Planctomycetaceae bacterium]|nr:DUF447 family protein [Planctomycetaceae bacterium]
MMVLEGLLVTLNEDQSPNLAPMGPLIELAPGREQEIASLVFRPFQTSRSFANLQRTRCGVFHVVDDVLLLALAALGRPSEPLEWQPAQVVDGLVLRSACRWYEFDVAEFDTERPRSEISTTIRHVGRFRDSLGFNRARHAVIEATILATRVHLNNFDELDEQWPWLASAIQKTGGPREREAFALVADHVERHRAEVAARAPDC